MERLLKVLQLPNKMANMIGSIIDALAVIGLTGLLAFFGFAFKKMRKPVESHGAKPSRENPARDALIENSNEKQMKITDALEDEDPAGALARLGNERRRK